MRGGNYHQLILLTETKANNDEKSSIEITFSTGGNSACQSGTEERSGFTAVCGTIKAISVCLLVFVAQIGQKKKKISAFIEFFFLYNYQIPLVSFNFIALFSSPS